MTKIPLFAVALVLLAGCTASPHSDTKFDDPRVIAAQDSAWSVFSFSYPGVDRPEVKVEKLMWGSDEQTPQLVECLHDSGYADATLTDGGTGISFEGGEDEALAFYVCRARFPLDPEYAYHPPAEESE
jgi:hypothetical protein